MKILLCGEYSSVHSELSAELKTKGYKVDVMSDGDGYKGFPADIKIPAKNKNRNTIEKILFLFLDFIGIYGFFNYLEFIKNTKIERYEIIQIINPVVIPDFGALGNFLLIRKLKKQSKKIFLCALGDDSTWVFACLTEKYKYSALDRLSFKNILKYYYSLKYIFSPAYLILDFYARKKSIKIIAGLEDYKIAYKKSKKLEFIRLPVSKEKFKKVTFREKNKENRITIFHAWQKGKELKKGNDILNTAVTRIIEKYSDRVNYIVASGMPYSDFIRAYSECDIYLDQIYSYDCGVSGVLGLSSGKVVFSGFELHKPYSDSSPQNIKNIGVNATKNLDDLVESLSYLIENPHVMEEIKENAFNYAIKNHESSSISDQYLDLWHSS